MMRIGNIGRLQIYPMLGFGSAGVEKLIVRSRASLYGQGHFALVGESGVCVIPSKEIKDSVRVEFHTSAVWFRARGMPQISVSMTCVGREKVRILVGEYSFEASVPDQDFASNWFSDLLQQQVRIVYLPTEAANQASNFWEQGLIASSKVMRFDTIEPHIIFEPERGVGPVEQMEMKNAKRLFAGDLAFKISEITSSGDIFLRTANEGEVCVRDSVKIE
jgi:hypothetical protein